MSEIDVLDVLNSMLETERAFLQALRFLSTDRESLVAFHQRNTATTLMLLRMYMASGNNTATFTIPITVPAGWNDPIVVRPTAAQITRATAITSVPPTDTNCSICQESLMDTCFTTTVLQSGSRGVCFAQCVAMTSEQWIIPHPHLLTQ
jgi:hypothetical protein